MNAFSQWALDSTSRDFTSKTGHRDYRSRKAAGLARPGDDSGFPQDSYRRAAAICLFGVLAVAAGCGQNEAPRENVVVVYTSVDRECAERVLTRVARDNGVRVHAVYDTEAGETSGFLGRIRREASSPRCDVWWSSEVFGTIELAAEGLLEPVTIASAADVPAEWKDPGRLWVGVAARARVLAYHRERLSPEDVPRTWREFSQGAWKGKLAISNPQFGTMRGHVASLFAALGETDGRELLAALKGRDTAIAEGNAHAVRLLNSGQADLCWTDADDVWSAQRRRQPIDLIYPPIDDGGAPLWIPCTVARVRGGPNPAAAARLLERLCSADVERELYASDGRNVPVRGELAAELGYDGPLPVAAGFRQIAQSMPGAMQAAQDILLE